MRGLIYFLISLIPCYEDLSLYLDSNRHILQEIISFMETNYASEISLDTLSQKVAMSKFTFIKVFRRFCGITPMQYLLNIRLNQSYAKLIRGASVTETAFDCGFNNLSYFTRQLKKKFYINPRQVKKKVTDHY